MASAERDPWVTEVQTALKQYLRAMDLAHHSARSWPAVRRQIYEGCHPVTAIRRIIGDGIRYLDDMNSDDANVLRRQYIKGETPDSIADDLGLDVSQFHRRRNQAVYELSVILSDMNSGLVVRGNIVDADSSIDLISTKSSISIIPPALVALLYGDVARVKSALSRYLGPDISTMLITALSNPDLSRTDYDQAVQTLHHVYEATNGDSIDSIIARQNCIHLLGQIAPVQSVDLFISAWETESHPWIKRSTLIAHPSAERYEMFLHLLSKSDFARQVTRTFPRVFYGDQPHQSGIFIDDGNITYTRTFWYYLTGYSRYLADPSLALVLATIRDTLFEKGISPLMRDPVLARTLYQALCIKPDHPLAYKEWNRLRDDKTQLLDKLKMHGLIQVDQPEVEDNN